MRGGRRGGLLRYVCCLDGMRGRNEGWGLRAGGGMRRSGRRYGGKELCGEHG